MNPAAASSPPTQLIVGSPQHGVVRYARSIADAIATVDPALEVVHLTSLDELWSRASGVPHGSLPQRAHLHVTDRLLGSDALDAAERVERLSAEVSLSITLHDLPQPSDGSGFARRIEGYRRIIAASRAIACNSRHEVMLISEHLGLDTSGIAVMPLPVADVMPDRSSKSPAAAARPEVAVLGFIYPGKGHSDVVRAVSEIEKIGRPRVVALGAPSPGHEADATRLLALAAELDVDVEVTGYLSDADQLERCTRAAVPIVALQHVSASGSTATWIEAGRRPLVRDSRYAREVSQLRPGSVMLYDPRYLKDAIISALGDPRSTRRSPEVDTRPHPGDTAVAYLNWWREVRW